MFLLLALLDQGMRGAQRRGQPLVVLRFLGYQFALVPSDLATFLHL